MSRKLIPFLYFNSALLLDLITTQSGIYIKHNKVHINYLDRLINALNAPGESLQRTKVLITMLC